MSSEIKRIKALYLLVTQRQVNRYSIKYTKWVLILRVCGIIIALTSDNWCLGQEFFLGLSLRILIEITKPAYSTVVVIDQLKTGFIISKSLTDL